MAVLQHYYTSFVNKETGSAGFQVKAMSPGIAPDTQSIITRLISYRIPPTLDEYDLSKHPVALRYYYKSSQEAILLCSQSNGTDENGRPGNFFAHSLVAEPSFFTSMPPILYWGSHSWCQRDASSNTRLPPLQSLEEVEAPFNIEEVWPFLAKNGRIEHFYKLMCAVAHYDTTQRRIVIIDSAANVALWIAAVTLMLPPDDRPLLSFATYHHDPYQSQFMITGTTPDSSFRASPDEYLSYFILNAQTGRVSDVQDSPYAAKAREAALSYEAYDTHLLTLIDRYTPRFPPPQRIDKQLDQLALYASVLAPDHPISLTAEELEAVEVVLTTFEHLLNFRQTEIDELRQLGDILQEASQSDADSLKQYGRVYSRAIALQKQHRIPTDQSALKQLTNITKKLIDRAYRELAQRQLQDMRQTFGDDIFCQTVNNSAYLQWLNKLAASPSVSADMLEHIWQQIGPFIQPGRGSQGFFLSSVALAIKLWVNEQTRGEGQRFLKSIIPAMAGREKDWLRLAAENYGRLSEKRALPIFYCELVESLDLEQRLPYRAIVLPAYTNIDRHELENDLSRACRSGVQHAFKELEYWIEHARRQRTPDVAFLVDAGVHKLIRFAERLEKKQPDALTELAPRILASSVLAPLPVEWESYLVNTLLSRVSFSRYASTDIALYRKYRDRGDLRPEACTIIDGLQAMKSGELHRDLAERLHQYFTSLSIKDLKRESESFIHTFLQTCSDDLSHQLMVNTVFISWEDASLFWLPYWQTMQDLLVHVSHTPRPKVLELLSFWFKAEPDWFMNMYTLHYFFLVLPSHLEEARDVRGFHKAADSIHAFAARQRLSWYPLVQDFLEGPKNVLASVGQGLGQGLAALGRQLRNVEEARAQDEKERQERAAFAASIGALFEKKRPRQDHSHLGSLYQWSRRELFWSAYWEHFRSLLLSKETEKTLDVLTFWFDDSFKTFKEALHIPQEFFLHFHNELINARKERAFQESAHLISQKVGKSRPEAYPWFGLVEGEFEMQERKFGFLRRS